MQDNILETNIKNTFMSMQMFFLFEHLVLRNVKERQLKRVMILIPLSKTVQCSNMYQNKKEKIYICALNTNGKVNNPKV